MARTGRPSTYKEEYCDLLVKHMAEGYSFESFGAITHTSKETLYTWTEKHEEFLDAKKEAEAKCRMFWENLGIKHVLNISEPKGTSYSLNSSVWIFNMRNRFGWRNETKEEIEDKAKAAAVAAKEVSLEQALEMALRDPVMRAKLKKALSDESNSS